MEISHRQNIGRTRTSPLPAPAKKQAETEPLRLEPEDRVEISTPGKKSASIIGEIGGFFAKLPKYANHVSRFIGATVIGGFSAAINLAGGALGLAGFAGLGLAGAMEVREGIRENDKIKILSGSGDVARGAFTGLLSANTLLDLGKYSAMVGTAAVGLGALQGGIHLSTGLMKYRQGSKAENGRRRLEGLLEMGMGAATLAMISGPLTVAGVAAYGALSTVRFAVVNKEKIVNGYKAAKKRTINLWKLIRGTDEPKIPAPYSSKLSEMTRTPEPGAAKRLENLRRGYHPSPYL